MQNPNVVHTPHDAIKPVADAFDAENRVDEPPSFVQEPQTDGRSFSITTAARRLRMAPGALMKKVRAGSVRAINTTSRKNEIPIEEILRLEREQRK